MGTVKRSKPLLMNYNYAPFYDEMFNNSGEVRSSYKKMHQIFSEMTDQELRDRDLFMQSQMVKEGITFTLSCENHDERSLERTIPFDIIPRIVDGLEWKVLEQGLKQRQRALNEFIWDIYHLQNILHDKIIPRKMIVTNPYFRREMMGVDVPNKVYISLSGIDLIRNETGGYYVLEDNLRTPSGLSYVYKNRSFMMHHFPELFFEYRVHDIDQGLNAFLSSLRSIAPNNKQDPFVVLLTPGSYNSAYYDHAFLAGQMGIPLVEGRDLTVIDHKVYMKSMKGLRQVDVIYRRIDDEFLDPLAFSPDSLLGVAGLMNAYRAGHVAIANAPGTGVADDKAIYVFVPDMIRYYLNEEPLLQNVPTYILSKEQDKQYVLAHLSEMVVKERYLSGGYGMLIGPAATQEELREFREKIVRAPEQYIAQPTMKLSCAPSLVDGQIVPRHIDLRAYVIMGNDINVIPGGLTRVGLKEGSLVVNSSQGGGSKDTWLLK